MTHIRSVPAAGVDSVRKVYLFSLLVITFTTKKVLMKDDDV